MSHLDSIDFAPLAGQYTVPLRQQSAASRAVVPPHKESLLGSSAGHIAIIGAGNAARSLACVLGNRGYSPHLLVRNPEKLQALSQRGSIKSSGKLEGDFSIVEVSNDFACVLSNCATVFVATTTDAYSEIAGRLAPHLTEHHEVVLFSSKFAGVVEFKHALGARRHHPAIMETDSLFASRIQDDDSIWIRGIKQWTLYSSYNKSKTSTNASIIRRFFPGLTEAENVVQRGLTDFGALAHPITMIANMNNVDRNSGFLFYYEGFTNQTVVLLERLEEEFGSLARAYGTSIIPMKELLNRYYGCDTTGDLLQAMRTVPNYSFSKAPGTLRHRFIEEDVASSLVPMQQLAHKAGIDTPMMDSIVNLSSILLGREFAKDGRTLAKLGWDNLSHKEIMKAIYE